MRYLLTARGHPLSRRYAPDRRHRPGPGRPCPASGDRGSGARLNLSLLQSSAVGRGPVADGAAGCTARWTAGAAGRLGFKAFAKARRRAILERSAVPGSQGLHHGHSEEDLDEIPDSPVAAAARPGRLYQGNNDRATILACPAAICSSSVNSRGELGRRHHRSAAGACIHARQCAAGGCEHGAQGQRISQEQATAFSERIAAVRSQTDAWSGSKAFSARPNAPTSTGNSTGSPCRSASRASG